MNGTVFTNETKALLKSIISDAIKTKVPVLIRPLIKPAVGIALNVLNNLGDKFIPDKVDYYINEAIVKANAKEWDNAAAAIGIAGDVLVDIPNVDDAHERNLFVTIAQAIVHGIRVWIEKKRE